MRTFSVNGCLAWLLAAAATLIAAPTNAQERTPVDELISRARAALDDLQYERADSIAQDVLRLGDAVTAEEWAVAQAITAAALYPEEPFFQRPDRALARLRQLVRRAPDAHIPRQVSWPGLDSLLETARRTTFAVRVEPRAARLLVGLDGGNLFDVVATRPVDASLQIATVDRGEIVLDSVSIGTKGELTIVPGNDRWRGIQSGDYILRVIARDVDGEEEIETAFRARMEIPQLQLLPVPEGLDESAFLPEETRPGRGRNALIGIGLGAATAMTANLFRASGPVGDVAGDGRAYAVAGALTLGALIGALAESPRPVPRNIAHNAMVRAEFAESVRHAEAENSRRRASYIVSVEFLEEVER